MESLFTVMPRSPQSSFIRNWIADEKTQYDYGEPYYPTPTEKGEFVIEPEAGNICYGTAALDQLTGSEKVFCILFDRSGNLLGDGALTSDARIAVKEWERDGYVRLSYCPSDHGIRVPSGVYDVYFYNEDGVILDHSSTYLN